MFDRGGLLAFDILNQGSVTRDIERLKPETDSEHRHRLLVRRGERQQIRLIFLGMHTPKSGVRFAAIAQRIHV